MRGTVELGSAAELEGVLLRVTGVEPEGIGLAGAAATSVEKMAERITVDSNRLMMNESSVGQN